MPSVEPVDFFLSIQLNILREAHWIVDAIRRFRVADPATSVVAPRRQFHPLNSSAFHGALSRQLYHEFRLVRMALAAGR